MNKILVTGGTGFIGQALVPALIQNGWQVTVLTRSAERNRDKLPAAVELIEALPHAAAIKTNADAWPWSTVINLAGENLFDNRWTESRKQTLRSSRLETTDTIVAAILAGAAVDLLISGSAIGYYGARGSTQINENSAPGDDFSAQLCIDWEQAARHAGAHCAVATVRTGIVLNPAGGALHQLLPPFKMAVGGRLGSGKQWFSWISRRDMVALLLFIIEQQDAGIDVSGAWNATAPLPVTNQTFTKAVGSALNRPTVLPMPAWALKAIMGEAAKLLVTGQRVLPLRAQQAGFSFQDADINQTMQEQLA